MPTTSNFALHCRACMESRECKVEAQAISVDGETTNSIRCPSCGVEVSGERMAHVVREAMVYFLDYQGYKLSLMLASNRIEGVTFESAKEPPKPDIEFLHIE